MKKKKRKMSHCALLQRLTDIAHRGDIEAAHIAADAALIEFIDDELITKAYEAIHKWYA